MRSVSEACVHAHEHTRVHQVTEEKNPPERSHSDLKESHNSDPKCADSSEYSGYLKAVFGALHSPVWRITMFDLRRQAGTLPQAVINN